MKVNITIPIYNEEDTLERCIGGLTKFLSKNFSYSWEIVIADNASTDRSLEIAKELSKKFAGVNALHIPVKGRGIALRTSWQKSGADIVSYMDVDLATELSFFPKLIDAIAKEKYDMAIGSRLEKESDVTRSIKREFFSRGYNLLLRALFRVSFRDAQCGFKAFRREIVQKIVPQVKDNKWFFDTELLVRAERQGYKVKGIPVIWNEAEKSTVKIKRDFLEMGGAMLKLRLSLLLPQASASSHS